jgi:hypothetical protein
MIEFCGHWYPVMEKHNALEEYKAVLEKAKQAYELCVG